MLTRIFAIFAIASFALADDIKTQDANADAMVIKPAVMPFLSTFIKGALAWFGMQTYLDMQTKEQNDQLVQKLIEEITKAGQLTKAVSP